MENYLYTKAGQTAMPQKKTTDIFDLIREKAQLTRHAGMTGDDLMKFKAGAKNIHFWCGELLNEKGTINGSNLTWKKNFVFDIEPTEDSIKKKGIKKVTSEHLALINKNLDKLKAENIHFAMYHSVSSNMKEGDYRLRIIVETPKIPAEDYQALSQTFAELYFPKIDAIYLIDRNSFLATQTMALPYFNSAYHDVEETPFWFENQGEPYDFQKLYSDPLYDMILKALNYKKAEKEEAREKARIECKTEMSNEEIVKTMLKWIKVERKNLDGKLGRKAMIQIKAWYRLGYISEEHGVFLMEKLAGKNPEYRYKNIIELRSGSEPDRPEAPEHFMKKVLPKKQPKMQLPIPDGGYRAILDRLREAGDNYLASLSKQSEDGNISYKIITRLIQQEAMIKVIVEPRDTERGVLAFYEPDKGVYISSDRYFRTLVDAVEDCAPDRRKREVITQLFDRSKQVEKYSGTDLVPLANGILNKTTGELFPFTPELVFLTKVGTAWNPNALEEPEFPYIDDDGIERVFKVSEWFKEMAQGDPVKERNFYMAFRMAIDSNVVTEQMMFLYSEKGGSGKGTFQQLLTEFVGLENTGSLRIDQFDDDNQFARVVGKSLIIGDEVEANVYIATTSRVKSVSEGEPVNYVEKYEKSVTVQMTPFIVQSTNGFPRFKKVDGGLERRLHVVGFPQITEGKSKRIKGEFVRDKKLHEWLLQKIHFMFKDCRPDEIRFGETPEAKEALGEMKRESSIVVRFYQDIIKPYFADPKIRLNQTFLWELFKIFELKEKPKHNATLNTFRAEIKSIMVAEGYQVKSDQRYTEEGQKLLTQAFDKCILDESLDGTYDPKYRDFQGTSLGAYDALFKKGVMFIKD